MGLARNLAVSHKATVAPVPQGRPSAWWVQLQRQVSEAGGTFGGGQYMETWSFSPGPQCLQSSWALQTALRGGTAPQPLTAGVLGAPRGLMVGLSALGAQPGEPVLSSWEAGKVVSAHVTHVEGLEGFAQICLAGH